MSTTKETVKEKILNQIFPDPVDDSINTKVKAQTLKDLGFSKEQIMKYLFPDLKK